MKLELHFDENVFRKQLKLFYDQGYSKLVAPFKYSNYIAISFIVIGVIGIVKNQEIAYFFLLLGLGLLTPYFFKSFKYRLLYRRFARLQKEIAQKYNENPIVTFEFSETAFWFSDYESEINIKWEEFLGYDIIDETLFLYTKTRQPFALSKCEVGEENYYNVLSIVKNHISVKSEPAANIGIATTFFSLFIFIFL